jgi:hypothetical protein
MQRPARRPQRLREMAHARQEHRNALLARPHMGRLFRHLRHPHRILERIEAIEGRGVDVQLVTQHDDERAQPAH